MRPRHVLPALAAILCLAGTASAAPMSILYDLDPAVRAIVAPSDGQRALGPDRGVFRQEPSGGHLFGGRADAPYRVAKVSMRDLKVLPAVQIAARLRSAVDHGCAAFGCESHLVGVDELGASVADGAAMSASQLREVKGRAAIRRAARRVAPIDPQSLAARFSAAMRILEVPSPYGGTYASRVHLFIAPAMTTSIAKGQGPNHNLGRDGKPHFTTWRAVMPGVALAGGVWLEMYHGVAGSTQTTPMTRAEWMRVAPDFLDLLSRAGGEVGQMHFLFTDAGMPKGAPAGCGSPMACSWALAGWTPVNQQVLANGPGTYRVGAAAGEWLAQYNLRFT